MILYHGTNQDIQEIDLSAGNRYKDFGQGFYLTPDRTTAERMAKKKAKFFGGVPTINIYKFDDTSISEEIRYKAFPEKATAEWIRFIDTNRDRDKAPKIPLYDIVSGPIADDGVVLQLSNYRNEILTPEEAARRLQDKYLDQQYFFGTKRALEYLTKIDVCQIS